MERSVIARGALAGLVGGLLAFLFARIMAEPVIGRAIDYEAARDEANAAIAHRAVEDGPELFSRTIQANVGIGVGVVAIGVAMGALFGVVYCVSAPKMRTMTPRALSLAIAMSMLLAVYLVPFVKYPANPPAIGNPDTIAARGGLYLLMVAISVALVIAAWMIGLAVHDRVGSWNAVLLGGAVVIVGAVIAMALLPSFGELAGNPPGATTETPQALRDASGNMVFPGFDADDLFSFRLYSVIAQLIMWSAIGLVGGELLHRLTSRKGRRADLATA